MSKAVWFHLESPDGSPLTLSHSLVKYHVCEIEVEKNFLDLVGSSISESLWFILSNFFESKVAVKRWQRQVKFDDQT